MVRPLAKQIQGFDQNDLCPILLVQAALQGAVVEGKLIAQVQMPMVIAL